jgi:hypothetical protein
MLSLLLLLLLLLQPPLPHCPPSHLPYPSHPWRSPQGGGGGSIRVSIFGPHDSLSPLVSSLYPERVSGFHGHVVKENGQIFRAKRPLRGRHDRHIRFPGFPKVFFATNWSRASMFPYGFYPHQTPMFPVSTPPLGALKVASCISPLASLASRLSVLASSISPLCFRLLEIALSPAVSGNWRFHKPRPRGRARDR